jgi:hypothetical protein
LLHVSVVQASPSLQSEFVKQAQQPSSVGGFKQLPSAVKIAG